MPSKPMEPHFKPCAPVDSATEDVSELYGGEVCLRFNKRKHIYLVTDPVRGYRNEWVPSVTGILGAIAKPALVDWAAREAAKKAVELLEAHGPDYWVETEDRLKDLEREAARAHRQRRDKAADIGTIVHEWIEQWAKGEEPEEPKHPEAMSAVSSFLEWAHQVKMQPLATEVRLYHRDGGYAGTTDLLYSWTGSDGQLRLELADIKTGTGVYPEYTLQLAAYAAAINDSMGEEVITTARVIRVGRDGTFEAPVVISSIDDVHAGFEVLQAARTIYMWNREVKRR